MKDKLQIAPILDAMAILNRWRDEQSSTVGLTQMELLPTIRLACEEVKRLERQLEEGIKSGTASLEMILFYTRGTERLKK